MDIYDGHSCKYGGDQRQLQNVMYFLDSIYLLNSLITWGSYETSLSSAADSQIRKSI